ncbi:MAG: hypothetical protein HDT27_04945 [Subdoligranulum sp.]|nr:hypothetical protein [Subdoligranulum sp.]
MTFQSRLQALGEALAALPPKCYHYWRPKMDPPFIVWAENGQDSAQWANNHMAEQTLGGSVHYFTKTEYDPVCDSIQGVLNSLGLGWALESVQYEEETNLIHYEWSWGAL